MTDEFTRQLNAIVGMKKTNGTLQLKIQQMEAQIDTLKKINEELTKHNTNLQNRCQEASQKCMELQQQQNQMAELYEGKILELKAIVEVKSAELERVSLNILPKFDQDMIRIKILNELELPHREEMQTKDEEIDRKSAQIRELQKKLELEMSKTVAIIQDRENALKFNKNQHIGETSVLMHQLSDLVAKQNASRQTIRILRREIKDLKLKLSSTSRAFQDQIQQMENRRYENGSAYKFQLEMGNLKKDLDNARLATRDAKEDSQKLLRQLQKSRQDYSKLALKWQEQETLLSEHRERQRQFTEKLDNATKNELEVQNLQQSVRSLRKELESCREQLSSEISRTKALQKQLSETHQALREKKQVVNTSSEPKLERDLTKQYELLSQVTKLKSENLTLIENLSQKQRKIQTLQAHINEGTRKPSPTRQRAESVKVQQLKDKLKVANQQILKLIKDKVSNARKQSPSR